MRYLSHILDGRKVIYTDGTVPVRLRAIHNRVHTRACLAHVTWA